MMTDIAAYALALAVLSAVNGAVTTIVTSSSLFEPVRLAVINRLSKESMLADLLTCDMCVGTWTGGLIAALAIPWLGLTGLDALYAGLVTAFSTMIGGAAWKRLADLY